MTRRFFGEITNNRNTPVSRGGDARYGISAHIRGWDTGVKVRMFVDENGQDSILVSLTGGSNDPAESVVIYSGPGLPPE